MSRAARDACEYPYRKRRRTAGAPTERRQHAPYPTSATSVDAMNRSHARDWSAQTGHLPATRHVYLLVAAHANGAAEAYPSVGTLATLSGLNPGTVRRALRALEATGDLETRHRVGDSSVYFVPGLPTYDPAHDARPPAHDARGGARVSDADPAQFRPEPRASRAPKELKVIEGGNGAVARRETATARPCPTCSDLPPGGYPNGVTRCPKCHSGWVPAPMPAGTL